MSRMSHPASVNPMSRAPSFSYVWVRSIVVREVGASDRLFQASLVTTTNCAPSIVEKCSDLILWFTSTQVGC